MSRPLKDGLDYFAFDVNLDGKWEFIEAKHGLIGFAVVVKLYQEIYKEGYFLKWNEKRHLIFSKRINVNNNSLSEIINDCINEGIFSETVYNNYSILTSRGIQKRYFEAVKRRNSIAFIKEIVLIDVSEYKNLINVDINSVCGGFSANKNGESKGKEIKEKKVGDSSPTFPISLSPSKATAIVKTFTSDHDAYRLAEILFQCILQNNPDSRMHNYRNGDRERTLQKWAQDVDLLIRKDGRDPSRIEEVIRFATEDSFWSSNILSGQKLRKQWDTLVKQLQSKRNLKLSPSKNDGQTEKRYDTAGRVLKYIG